MCSFFGPLSLSLSLYIYIYIYHYLLFKLKRKTKVPFQIFHSQKCYVFNKLHIKLQLHVACLDTFILNPITRPFFLIKTYKILTCSSTSITYGSNLSTLSFWMIRKLYISIGGNVRKITFFFFFC